MFFILSKVLYFFINPFSWVLISLLIFLFVKDLKWKKYAKMIFVLVTLFFSNTFLFLEFERLWEVERTNNVKSKSYDVGIVLSGMFDFDNDRKELSVRRGADRLWQTITLYKKGVVKKIFITGGSGYISDRGLNEAKQIKEVLLSWGFPEKDIIIESNSRNTYENAIETKKILNRSYPHVKKCLLITSAQHMRRSRAIFLKQEIDIDTYSTDFHTGKNRNYYWDQYFIPNIETLGAWNGLIKEWVGFVVYDIMGYL
jgi:uncharacterized SAM-binding protein YcdF (DUF218 family)